MSNNPTEVPVRAGSGNDATNQEAKAGYRIAQENTPIFIRSLVDNGLNIAEITLILTKTLTALKPKDTAAELEAAVADCLNPPPPIEERFEGWELHMLKMLRKLFEVYEKEAQEMIAWSRAQVENHGITGADTTKIEFMNEWVNRVKSHLRDTAPGVKSVLSAVREAAAREAAASEAAASRVTSLRFVARGQRADADGRMEGHEQPDASESDS